MLEVNLVVLPEGRTKFGGVLLTASTEIDGMPCRGIVVFLNRIVLGDEQFEVRPLSENGHAQARGDVGFSAILLMVIKNLIFFNLDEYSNGIYRLAQ